MDQDLILMMSIVIPIIGIIFAAFLSYKIIKQDEGNKDVQFIGNAIKEGAMAFISKEYRVLSVVVLLVAITIGLLLDFDILDTQTSASSSSLPSIALSLIHI